MYQRAGVLKLAVLAAIVTLVFLTIYATVQQSLRMSADDPQIQLAEDAAQAAETGADPASLIGGKVNARSSLAPFLIAYDASGTVVASAADLSGVTPRLPTGVFDEARREERRFTWQPESGVRIAAVVVHHGGPKEGFFLSGRSLKEVEQRESTTLLLAALGWAASLCMALLTMAMASLRARSAPTPPTRTRRK